MDPVQDKVVTVVDQPKFDLSMLIPVVTELQKGEVEKVRLNNETQRAIAQMNFDRQIELDKHAASREARHDKFEINTTVLLSIGCAVMMGFGIYNRDSGFITAGMSSFCTYLVGARSARTAGKPKS